MIPYLLLAAPALVVLAITGFNVWVWPRGRPDERINGRVSVLIPARDEVHSIERCVRAALAGTQLPDEVLIYDDASADGTDRVLRQLAAENARVRVLGGKPLPAGWIGKVHACHRLAEHATGDVLVFADADTALLPTGLARMGSVIADYRADVVSAGLRQEMRTWAERLVIPLLHLTYLAWLPLPLVWRSRDPRFLVANGQILAVRRDAYRRAGGWAGVHGEVVDDMAFCRAVKRSGGRVVFADGWQMASCRMYRGARELWQGFSKNLYEGIGGRPGALVGVVALYAWTFVAPYLALVGALVFAWPSLLQAALVGVAANLALRMLLAIRFRQPPEGVLLHPFAVLGLLGIALNSFRWSLRGVIRWRGRSYPRRAARTTP